LVLFTPYVLTKTSATAERLHDALLLKSCYVWRGTCGS